MVQLPCSVWGRTKQSAWQPKGVKGKNNEKSKSDLKSCANQRNQSINGRGTPAGVNTVLRKPHECWGKKRKDQGSHRRGKRQVVIAPQLSPSTYRARRRRTGWKMSQAAEPDIKEQERKRKM